MSKGVCVVCACSVGVCASELVCCFIKSYTHAHLHVSMYACMIYMCWSIAIEMIFSSVRCAFLACRVHWYSMTMMSAPLGVWRETLYPICTRELSPVISVPCVTSL